MVTATAALVRAIDPSLTAAQVKDIITGSAATGDAQVGGKQLRSELAVRKAIDGARVKAKLPADRQDDRGGAERLLDHGHGLHHRAPREPGRGDRVVGPCVAPPPRGRLAEPGRRRRPAHELAAARPPGRRRGELEGPRPKAGVPIIVTRLDNGFWVKYTLLDDGRPTASPKASPTPTPKATPKPTARPKPTPTPADIGCSGPPPGVEPGTIAYVKWSLKCGGPIAP